MSVEGDRKPSLIYGPGSLRKCILLPLGIGIMTFGWGSLPALLDHGHRADDMTHGMAMPTAISLTLFLMFLFLGMRRVRLCGDDGKSPWVYFWGTLVSLFVLGMAAILFFCSGSYRLAVDLSAHGIPAQAHLVRQFTEGCSKNGCVTGLEYSFVPKGRAEPVLGFVSVGDVRQNHDVYDYAMSTGTVPILYDQTNPSRSMVYWRDQIQRQASGIVFVEEAGVFVAILMFGLALLAAMLLPVARGVAAAQKAMS